LSGGQAAQAVVRGARTTFAGFVLRLGGRLPFLLIAGHLYGSEALGLFAYATAVVELVALLAGFGLRRSLLQHLAQRPDSDRAAAEAMALTLLATLVGIALLTALPQLAFPDHPGGLVPRLFPLIMLALVLCELCIAALSHHHLMIPQVIARAIVEPWVLTLTAAVLAFTPLKPHGLFIAYAAAMSAAAAVAVFYYRKRFRLGALLKVKRQDLKLLVQLSAPVWLADAVEVGQRRVDLLILGQMTTPTMVGLYYAGQQVATLMSRLRGSFEPILTPVMAKLSAARDRENAARQLDQVRFWLFCAQLAAMLGLSLYATSLMTMIGSSFSSGGPVMILLLVAELFWGVLGIAELPLLFSRARLNLMIGVFAITVEAALALWLIPLYGGIGAAVSLCSAFLIAGAVKTVVVAQMLDHAPAPARMFWPACFAALATLPVLALPQTISFPWSMLLGLPLFLSAYGLLLWRFAFNDADRLLFRKLA
jgi:O-antigen/teichoic acid export membrane protein